MASGGCEDTSDEVFNFKCTPCAKKNENREAVKYCVECQGYCCRSCADIHKVFPTLEGHQFLDKSDFKSTDITSDLPEIPTVRCQIHKVKVMDMYCGNHDLVGCTSCMALTHRACTDVQLIPDIINTIFKKADVDKTSVLLQDKIKQFEKIIDTRVAHLKELKDSKIEATSAMEQFKKELEHMLQSLFKESMNEVEEEYCKRESMLNEEKKKAETEVENIKQADDNMRLSDANKAQQFVSMKIAQEKVANADVVISSIETPSDIKLKFNEDENVRDALRRLKTLGTVNCASPLKPRSSAYSVKRTSDLNVRLTDDESICNIISSCLTENGLLLLSDRNNQKLKRVDTVKMSVVDQCNLPCSPYCVCGTRKHEAAVCLGNTIIQFVSLANKMALTSQLKLGHNVYGIAYKADILYVTDNGSFQYMYDMKGNKLKKISQDTSGKNIFNASEQIIFNDSGNKLLMVDWSDRVITVDTEGRYINSMSDSNVACAHGVCTDGRGNVFVCGCHSHNVIQMRENGDTLGPILTSSNGLSYPWSVCFDHRRCILYVTQSSSDKVKVFNLQ